MAYSPCSNANGPFSILSIVRERISRDTPVVVWSEAATGEYYWKCSRCSKTGTIDTFDIWTEKFLNWAAIHRFCKSPEGATNANPPSNS